MNEVEFNELDQQTTALAKVERQQESALVREQLGRDAVSRAAQRELAKRRFSGSLTPAETGAVVEYCRELGVGINGVDVLFGRLYLNADAYFEKAGQVFPEGISDMVNITDAKTLRIEWGVPECAEAAYLCYFWKRRDSHDSGLKADTVEVGYAPKTLATGKDGKLIDGIGKAEPWKTARTRAARRALRTVVPFFSKQAEAIEQQFTVMAEQSKQIGRASDEAVEAPPMVHPVDPYGDTGRPSSAPAPGQGEVPDSGSERGMTNAQLARLNELLVEGEMFLSQAEVDRLQEQASRSGRTEAWWTAKLAQVRDLIQSRADAE